MHRSALVLVAALLVPMLGGCIPPQSPVEKLTDNAYDVVMAARFGRMDLVTAMVKPSVREEYMASHAEWGGRVRILDIDYGGLRLVGEGKAVVAMTVSWQRLDESMLRTTAIAQTWHNDEGGWLIESEDFAGGDKGLLLKPEPKRRPKKSAPTESADSATAAQDASSPELAATR